jgi:hypothetical protein
VSGGAYQVSPTKLGGDAAAVFNVDEWLPTYFEPKASIVAGKPTGGYKSNAYLIFDYQSLTDFKFADVSLNSMVMGHRNASGWIGDVQTPGRDGLKGWYGGNGLLR